MYSHHAVQTSFLTRNTSLTWLTEVAKVYTGDRRVYQEAAAPVLTHHIPPAPPIVPHISLTFSCGAVSVVSLDPERRHQRSGIKGPAHGAL